MKNFRKELVEALRPEIKMRLNVKTQLLSGYLMMVTLLVAVFAVSANGLRTSGDATHTTVVITAILAAAALMVVAGLGLYLAQRISSSVNNINEAMKKVADGDLTTEMDFRSLDEFGEMSLTYTKMVGDLRGLIDNVRYLSDNLDSTSRQLACAARQAGAMIKSVSDVDNPGFIGSAEKLKNLYKDVDGLDNLHSDIELLTCCDIKDSKMTGEATTLIGQMSNASRKVSDKAQCAASGAVRTVAIAKNGMNNVEKTIRGMKKYTFATDNVINAVAKIGMYSDKLVSITTKVNDISKRTNAIADSTAHKIKKTDDGNNDFNRIAIEANQLAEQTAIEAKEISDLIDTVLVDVNHCLEATQDSSKWVEESYKLAGQAGIALDEVMGAVEETSLQIDQVLASADDLNAFSMDLGNMVESVLGELVSSSRLLSRMSKDLQVSVAMFKISENSDSIKRDTAPSEHKLRDNRALIVHSICSPESSEAC